MHPGPSNLTPGPPDLDRVRRVVDLVRPHVQADGGDIELVGLEPGGVVAVRMLGSCHGCPSSDVTLASSLERNLKSNVPGVTGVRVVA
ncbi:MAG: NifU family protein [Phycisphaerales bacterium]